MIRAIFLDRDGTLIEEAGYLADPAGVRLTPGAGEALASLKAAGYALVVVTNQSGVARGFYGMDEVGAVNAEVGRRLKPFGVTLDGFYVCPHLREITGPCECRKPAPGMLLAAAAELGIDLSASWMVGDKADDVEAGLRAGCRAALVLTGYGEKELEIAALRGIKPDLTADSLAMFATEALRFLNQGVGNGVES